MKLKKLQNFKKNISNIKLSDKREKALEGNPKPFKIYDGKPVDA